MRAIFSAKITAVAVSLLTALSAHAQDIKLGFNGDLSASPSAQSGKAGVIGIEAAISDINAAGGVLGRKLALTVRDDQSQPQKSIQNMSDLIDNEKATVIFGPVNAASALSWKAMVNQKKVVSMGMIAANSEITKPGRGDNYMFRVSMVDRDQVAALVAYVKRAGVKKIGLMGETTSYGQGGLKDLQEVSKLQGIEVIATENFGVADTDMTSQLNKMKSAGVDTVLVWAQGTPMGSLLRSMEKLNYFPSMLTSWAADNITFFDAAGKTLAEKPIFIRTMADALTPSQQKLYDRVGSKLAAPSAFPFAVHGYDATLLIAEAMREAGSPDGDKVKAALENLQKPVVGMLKTYAKPFSNDDHEGVEAADMVFIKWKDAKLTPYTDNVTKALTPKDFIK